ncbi:uncharacterized protein PpBr36_10369 [Pyricularia pennisetigena]|uniref:uncharacterized protein n=1 Tax=Pyricularia pennisetigena TaxID=1578925 RepID=UPI00115403A3|nr:uncharacterized protein PpBr36_10369 [Pyricularia pennisetigena]TLS21338.1 hypothetical protein PpBr36_10369 [Pyricularia pennisetigena]
MCEFCWTQASVKKAVSLSLLSASISKSAISSLSAVFARSSGNSIPVEGRVIIPRFGKERLQNEANSLRFISEKTNIPVPKFIGHFEDDGAVYLITEFVEGIAMSELPENQRKEVEVEVEAHLQTLKQLKSSQWGGPSGLVIPPYRIMQKTFRSRWTMKNRDSKDLVFCHNDLSTHNIIVDEKTLKIKAILDWEYAGFFPAEFEGMYFRRPGASVALDGEDDDVEKLLEVMRINEA